MKSILYIPELIDQIVGSADAGDLHACALVCRRWAHAAQSRIFSNIKICDSYGAELATRQMSRLLNVFDESPHLATFVLTLELWLGHQVGEIHRLCRSGLTVLRTLFLYLPTPLPSRLLPTIKSLLALESLTSVTLHIQFEHLEDLLDVWRDCSRNIRYVEFPRAPSVKPAEPSARPSMCLDPHTKIQLDVFEGVPDAPSICHD
ncbi:hypothetical protein FB45DRAFT_123493 [Roridomyces roridus]|uniref:F-box domain-containing protein n=1 Tax=Roridomyces roridus TaxID=1738132 RepID=A0AAD7BIM3_9AGAR|nr:hypothetical protein FB45DRAFT_123493 [Roridomyces roridus]